MSNKTLVGKNNILFLSSGEIELHCNNKYNKKNTKISEYNFNNFFITVFPDKSVYYKQYLPDVYKSMYRPSLEIYKLKFNDKLFDAYETLCNVDDAYYKTDSHINFYGSYLVFLEFIKRINNIYNLKIESKNMEISVLKNINITNLNRGIGDLTWSHNLGNIILENTEDNYYYSNDVLDFYTKYKINDENNIRFLNYELNDDTTKLIDTIVDWNIISNYIII